MSRDTCASSQLFVTIQHIVLHQVALGRLGVTMQMDLTEPSVLRCSVTNVEKNLWEQWATLPSMWNFKETQTEKCVAQFVRWEICHWTLLWKRISLWNYCSVLGKRSDEGPSISCLIISCIVCSEWTSFLLPNLYSHSFLFRVFKFIKISWYFSKNWTIKALKIFSVWYLLDQTQYLVFNMKCNLKLETVLKDDWFEFQF